MLLAAATASILAAHPAPLLAESPHASLIYETPREFFGRADFNGDGLQDLVIVDKETGKYRLGYQTTKGLFSWVDCRPSGLKGVAGFSIGKVLATNLDAPGLFRAGRQPDRLGGRLQSHRPRQTRDGGFYAPRLGRTPSWPSASAAPGRRPWPTSTSAASTTRPTRTRQRLMRNDGAEYPKLADIPLPGAAVRGNRLSLKAGQPELLCLLVTEQKGDTFHAQDLASGKPVEVATVTGLPAGSDYAVGNFRGSPLREFLFYKPGANSLTVRPVEEAAPGKLQLGKGDSFDLGQPIRRVITLDESAGQKLFVIFGEGEKAGVFSFDGAKAPVLVQAFTATNYLFTCAASVPGGFIAFSQPAEGKFSTRYQVYKASGGSYTPGTFGSLASLADNDNITIPDIHARIVANLKVKEESEMKPYTNTIPGHAGDLCHGAHPWRRVRHGQPGHREGPQARRRPAAQGEDRALLDGAVRGHVERIRAVHVSRRRAADARHGPDGRRRR